MKILLIEDDCSIRNVLRMGLQSRNHIIDEAPDGEQGSYLGRINEYDVIVLDNVLPRKMGKEVCREIRKAGRSTPIVMLSQKSASTDKVELLGLGADDYVTKPFSFDELCARLHAVSRRRTILRPNVLSLGEIQLYPDKYTVIIGGEDVYFTRKEFSLFHFLLINRGKVTTRADLIEHVWDMNIDAFSNTLETHILNIRKKIGDGRKNIIKNIPGVGYKIS